MECSQFFLLIFQNHYTLLELAPFALLLVAGCHWASPSTTLDKRGNYKIGIMIKQIMIIVKLLKDA